MRFGLGVAAGLALAAPAGAQAPAPAAATEPRIQVTETLDLSVDRTERMTVPVSIGGSGPYGFIVDTGAERTVIAPAALARAGLDAGRGREVGIVGVTGSAAAREVLVERLDVGGTRVGPISVIAHDIGFRGVDGLLGRDVLDAFTVTIDAAAGRATLAPR
jgi:predicted aspartyl protease